MINDAVPRNELGDVILMYSWVEAGRSLNPRSRSLLFHVMISAREGFAFYPIHAAIS